MLGLGQCIISQSISAIFFCTVMAVHTPGCVSALAGGCGKGLAGGVTGYAQHGAARSQIAIL